jgi:hypothetical protein
VWAFRARASRAWLGLAAYRAGKKLEYDGTTGWVTNGEAANAFLLRTYREGWELDA